jgi:hypothetical protein
MQTRRGPVRVGARESPAVPAKPGAHTSGHPLRWTAGALMFMCARGVSQGQAVHLDYERARDRALSLALGRPAALLPWSLEGGPGVRRSRPEAAGVARDRSRGRKRVRTPRKAGGQAAFVRSSGASRPTPRSQAGSPARVAGAGKAGSRAATNAGSRLVHSAQRPGDRLRDGQVAGMELFGRDRPVLRLGGPVRRDHRPDGPRPSGFGPAVVGRLERITPPYQAAAGLSF